mgnify:FL=1|jgi:hypothetical protein|tara:strand:+ start:633 stop:956 length:324 start_codon:yes stop_codon:yes gene_type:complete
MTKVFITTNQKTKMGGYRDVSDCERFGTPTVLFENPRQVQVNSIRFVGIVEQKLKDFTSEDFLLLMGDPVLIGICCTVAAKKTNNKFKVLKWDREQSIYIPIIIELA